jgi:hypothetical protein
MGAVSETINSACAVPASVNMYLTRPAERRTEHTLILRLARSTTASLYGRPAEKWLQGITATMLQLYAYTEEDDDKCRSQ